jgi:hypothetical protein
MSLLFPVDATGRDGSRIQLVLTEECDGERPKLIALLDRWPQSGLIVCTILEGAHNKQAWLERFHG